MIKSANHIYMDYSKMMQSANELEEVASRIESTVKQKLEGYCDNPKYWTGDAAAVCRKKVDKYNSNLRNEAKKLRDMAGAIRRAAERERQLELAIIAMMKK